MLAVGLLANCPRGALSSTPSPQGGCECNWGTPEEPDVRDRATSCPLFSQFWEELGRTEVRGREDLDMARKPLCQLHLVLGQVNSREVISTHLSELCTWGERHQASKTPSSLTSSEQTLLQAQKEKSCSLSRRGEVVLQGGIPASSSATQQGFPEARGPAVASHDPAITLRHLVSLSRVICSKTPRSTCSCLT